MGRSKQTTEGKFESSIFTFVLQVADPRATQGERSQGFENHQNELSSMLMVRNVRLILSTIWLNEVNNFLSTVLHPHAIKFSTVLVDQSDGHMTYRVENRRARARIAN